MSTAAARITAEFHMGGTGALTEIHLNSRKTCLRKLCLAVIHAFIDAIVRIANEN